jgi:Rrf2 family nitric oxide-sensitive transcriptional repressor
MQLKRYTDYALRVLLYLGAHPGEVVSISRIAQAYGVSRNHLLKVLNGLVEQGLVTTLRGNRGGVQLALPPQAINVGAVISHMEGDRPMIDCAQPPCPIAPACQLQRVLNEARQDFLARLSGYTLADLIQGKRRQLIGLLAGS